MAPGSVAVAGPSSRPRLGLHPSSHHSLTGRSNTSTTSPPASTDEPRDQICDWHRNSSAGTRVPPRPRRRQGVRKGPHLEARSAGKKARSGRPPRATRNSGDRARRESQHHHATATRATTPWQPTPSSTPPSASAMRRLCLASHPG
jgi:hypothetical protein